MQFDLTCLNDFIHNTGLILDSRDHCMLSDLAGKNTLDMARENF